MNEALIFGAAFAALFLTVVSLGLSLYCVILVKAFEKSTHQVQYVPIDPEFKEESEKQAREINKNFKEEVEDNFSDIFPEQSY